YDRIFTPMQHRNAGVWGWLIVYGSTVVIGLLPWWPVLLSGGVHRKLRGDNTHCPHLSPDVRVFMWLWFAIPMLVFCFARSRLPLYVLPLFMPLSLLVASGMRQWAGPGKMWQC